MPDKSLSNQETLKIRHEFCMSLVLIVVTLAVYYPVKNYEFVNFDDGLYVTENPHVRGGLNVPNIAWAITTTHASNWHPVTWLSHMMDVEFHGLDPGAHHLTNVFFHLINSLLLFFILRKATHEVWPSVFVAALFALHPLHVESVAWVSERKDVLSAFFWMLTIWSYIHYVENPSKIRYVTVVFLFFLGLTAKPMVVTLPFVLLLLDYWPLERFKKHQKDIIGGSPWTRAVLEKIPLFMLSAASCTVTYLAQQTGGAVRSLDTHTIGTRLVNALVSYAVYILKMFWPDPLAVPYPYPEAIPIWKIVGAAVLLMFVTFMVVATAKRHPYGLFGWLFFLGTLVPVIGIVQVGPQPFADRYTYIPLIGLFVIITWGISRISARFKDHVGLLAIAGISVLIALFIVSSRQVDRWKNSIALFTHTTQSTSNNHIALNNLGLAVAEKGDFETAAGHYLEALRIKPDFVRTLNNLGVAMVHLEKATVGIEYYVEALRLKPADAGVHFNLGNALMKLGRVQEALDHYRLAVRIKPADGQSIRQLGAVLIELGRFEEAVDVYSNGLRFHPEDFQIHYNLGLAYTQNGNTKAASTHFWKALHLNPNDADVHNNVGFFLLKQGRAHQALNHFHQSLTLNPDHSGAAANVKIAESIHFRNTSMTADLLASVRNNPSDASLYYRLADHYAKLDLRDQAVEVLRKALQVNPDLYVAGKRLGMLLAQSGNYQEAFAVFKQLFKRYPKNALLRYDIARLYAIQNRLSEAVDWIRKAIDLGFDDWDRLKSDPVFSNLNVVVRPGKRPLIKRW